MPLLNYTTKVPAERTISEIQRLLVGAGARKIGTEYADDGTVTAIAFTLETVAGLRGFTLPVEWGRVLAVLERQKVSTSASHAERVAWRIVKDWLEAQLAIVETEMVEFEQVMLPYMHASDGRTMFEMYRDGQMAALEAGR